MEQRDIDVLFQPQKELYSKVEILNANYKILHSIEGILISDSYSNNADSDIRRTYSCDMHLDDNSYLIAKRSQLINKIVRPYVGIKHTRTKEVIWYLIGTFRVVNGNYTFDDQNKNMSLSCEDMMCTLNGSLSGNITDRKIKIIADEDLRTSIIQILNDAGIVKYNICSINKTVPSDLEYTDGTYYDILKQLLELYPGYEMFFDLNGLFNIKEIPKYSTDENIINDKIIQPLLIRDNGSFNFADIYNKVIVYGMEIETERDLDTCIYENNVYKATTKILNSYENLVTYSVELPNECLDKSMLSINSLPPKYIVSDDNVYIKAGELKKGKYSFRYRKLTDDFLLLGKYQCEAEATCIDNTNPFSINNIGYEVVKVLHEDKLYSDALCKEKAEYELYLSTCFNESIELEMIFIPFLDVNKKIEYTSPLLKEKHNYIIKSISGSTTSGTMTVSAAKFYKDYSTMKGE